MPPRQPERRPSPQRGEGAGGLRRPPFRRGPAVGTPACKACLRGRAALPGCAAGERCRSAISRRGAGCGASPRAAPGHAARAMPARLGHAQGTQIRIAPGRDSPQHACKPCPGGAPAPQSPTAPRTTMRAHAAVPPGAPNGAAMPCTGPSTGSLPCGKYLVNISLFWIYRFCARRVPRRIRGGPAVPRLPVIKSSPSQPRGILWRFCAFLVRF